MKVNFYLKRYEAKKPTAIYANIHYDDLELKKYYLPESIKPTVWDGKKHRAKLSNQYPEHNALNTRLDNISLIIKNTIRNYINANDQIAPLPEELKGILDKVIRPNKKYSGGNLLTYYTEHIKLCEEGKRLNTKTGKRFSKGTIKTYNLNFNHLKKFAEDWKRPLIFKNIDLDFYGDFLQYCLESDFSTNYIGLHIKNLKTILNDATARGVNNTVIYKSRLFAGMQEDVDSIYLTTAEIKELKGIKLMGEDEQIRDLFIIGCYTGLRFSDLTILNASHIKNGFIDITQTKTGDPIVIPLHDEVKEILKKYKGSLPVYKTNQETNEALKEIAAEAKLLQHLITITKTKGGKHIISKIPKYKLVTTHAARRSFATNEYKAGTPVLTIMAITGHKTEKSFLKYIKVTPDEHAKLLQQHWEERAKKKS